MVATVAPPDPVELLAHQRTRSVHVRGDAFRKMVVNGREDLSPHPIEAALAQLHLRYRLAAHTADTWAEASFDAIVRGPRSEAGPIPILRRHTASAARETFCRRILGGRLGLVPHFRVSEAAGLLGVSDDTVRRWAEQGRLPATRTDSGRLVIEGADLAGLAQELADSPEHGTVVGGSARNRFRGIVTKVTRDTVMAQVEMQAGPFRVVSLMSREAADELGLDVGTLAVASVKSTHVVVELPDSR